MTALAPGLYRDYPRAFYEVLDAVNVSKLVHFERSAVHAYEAMMHPPAPTKSMSFGTQYHSAVLESDEFTNSYASPPKCDRRTTAGKRLWNEFEEAHPNAEMIAEDDYRDIIGMRDRLFTDPLVSRILGGVGMNEVSAIFTDAQTGLTCKARLDRLCEFDIGDGSGVWSWIVDLKSCEDARPHAFFRDAKSLNYGPKIAFYHRGCEVLAPRERRALWIAQERKAPYEFMLYEVSAEALAAGRAKCDRWLWRYKEATESQAWAGYPREVQLATERDTEW